MTVTCVVGVTSEGSPRTVTVAGEPAEASYLLAEYQRCLAVTAAEDVHGVGDMTPVAWLIDADVAQIYHRLRMAPLYGTDIAWRDVVYEDSAAVATSLRG